jgi:hypothetical protein
MAAKKSTTKKTNSSKKQAQNTNSFEQLQNDAKEVLYAGLGVYGRLFDEVNARMDTARNGRSKNWKDLVARGEKLHKDFNETVESGDWPVSFDMDEMRANIEKKFEELSARFKPADA